MRIDTFHKVSQLYQADKTTKIKRSESKSFKDKVEISQAGKDYQTAKAAVAAAPDIREDKVEAIKQKIASGTYDVSGEKLADKLIDRYFNQSV